MNAQQDNNISSITENRGRKEIFDDEDRLMELLISIRDKTEPLTHYMKHRLVEKELVSLKRVSPPAGHRGRPTEVPELTGIARRRLGAWLGRKTMAARRAA